MWNQPRYIEEPFRIAKQIEIAEGLVRRKLDRRPCTYHTEVLVPARYTHKIVK